MKKITVTAEFKSHTQAWAAAKQLYSKCPEHIDKTTISKEKLIFETHDNFTGTTRKEEKLMLEEAADNILLQLKACKGLITRQLKKA